MQRAKELGETLAKCLPANCGHYSEMHEIAKLAPAPTLLRHWHWPSELDPFSVSHMEIDGRRTARIIA